jgi:ferric iron reductase protein FhuF
MRTFFRSGDGGSSVSDAIRDFLIVVVGILGALWIEAWWQGVQESQEEREILENLRAEFVANRDQLVDIVSVLRASTEAAENTHKLTLGPLPNDYETILEKYIDSFMRKLRYDPRMGQLTSVISSGKIGLISNSELRARIADWPDLISDIEDNENMIWNHTMNFLSPYLNTVATRWDESAFETDAATLLKDRYFDNLLGENEIYVRSFVRESGDVLAATNRIIGMIDGELNR